MTFKVEKGIPLPPPGGGRARINPPFPFAEMAIGDSFFAPCDGDAKALKKLRWIIQRAAVRRRNEVQADFAVTTRIEAAGVRCWRTEFVERQRKPRKPRVPLAPAASTIPPPIPEASTGARVHKLANAEDEHFDAGGRTRLAAKPAKVPKMSFDIPKFADGGKPRAVKGSRY
jgi:hypothetical protein